MRYINYTPRQQAHLLGYKEGDIVTRFKPNYDSEFLVTRIYGTHGDDRITISGKRAYREKGGSVYFGNERFLCFELTGKKSQFTKSVGMRHAS